MKVKLTPVQQSEVIRHVSTTYTEYKELMSAYLSQKAEEYEEYTTFEIKKKTAWDTNTKVNKAFEAVEKWCGKLTSKEPVWITSVRPDIEYKLYQWDAESMASEVENVQKTSRVTESILKDTRKRGDVVESTDRMAKDLASLWVAIGKATYKYKVNFKENEEEEVSYDEEGNEVVSKVRSNIGKVSKIPSIEWVSVDRVFYDINYKDFDDIPCIIEIVDGVRWSHILGDKSYDNLKELSEIIKEWRGKNTEELSNTILRITWIAVNNPTTIDDTNLVIKEYYGYFNLTDDPKKEKLYKFCVVNDMLVIQAKEIKKIPYAMVRCFEDTLSLKWFGIVRPVIGLQKEFNFKRSARSQYIKQSLNRKYIMWPWSGMSPKDLSKPDGIVFTDKDVATVQAHFMELPHREINSSIFSDNADDQREMQTMMFSIDTTQPSAQWSTIDTATWSKIEFYENNIVINKVRVKFERFIAKLWEIVLYAMVENMWELDNYYTKVDSELIAIHKTQIEKALNDLSINIEIGSTNYEKEKQRRDELLAIYNLALKSAQSWLNVNLEKIFKQIMETYNIKDAESFIKPDMGMLWIGGVDRKMTWQSLPQSLLDSMNQGSWSQTMDMTNSIAGTSVNLPV